MRFYRVNFRSLAALTKAAATALNRDKAVRVHKVAPIKRKVHAIRLTSGLHRPT